MDALSARLTALSDRHDKCSAKPRRRAVELDSRQPPRARLGPMRIHHATVDFFAVPRARAPARVGLQGSTPKHRAPADDRSAVRSSSATSRLTVARGCLHRNAPALLTRAAQPLWAPCSAKRSISRNVSSKRSLISKSCSSASIRLVVQSTKTLPSLASSTSGMAAASG